MKKIALCVATYEHAEIVEDVLSQCIEDYYRCGIDIYYYDSSEDNNTEEVVKRFIALGYDNLFYIKVNCGFDEKIEMIYSGYGLKYEYDYIWPSKDRSFFSLATLLKIKEVIDEGHDFILLGVINDGKQDTTVYTDAREFYEEWAWLATSLDVVLYKYSTTLKNYDSKVFNERFAGRYMDSWRVYMYLFTTLYELEKKYVKVLVGEDIKVYNSIYGKSSWENKTFIIWKDDWLEANDNLPDYYSEYKDKVIRRVATLPWILGSVERLMKLHEEGILIEENLPEIEKNWERVSDIPISVVRKIACDRYDIYHDMDILKTEGTEMSGILIRMYEMVDEGRIDAGQIPWDDIKKYVMAIYREKFTTKSKYIGIFEGSLQDIMRLNGNTVREEAKKSLQLAINLLYILEH